MIARESLNESSRVIASAATQSGTLITQYVLDCHVAALPSMTLSIGPCCAEACALDRSESFHRPAAGEALFKAERAENALRRVARRCGSCRTDCLRFSPNAGRHQLGHPCLRSLRDPARFARYAFTSPLRGSLGRIMAPCSRIRLRCSACFTARCRTWPVHPCAIAPLFCFIPPTCRNVPW